ncbi:Aldo/keto reductase [Exidia glandulosa HHB12029]|uniref:Aldo/keto reductase n=1 Tax=Exidia glandulosa HHB12029 TaxID=1314781 RepID=A0A165KD18_EXIGL|nr:Aldo/keto reductase [Exidia glandulosa HHB12029]
MPLPETVTLNTGAKMPTLGLGTWKSSIAEVENAVKVALENGYRHIDTAAGYRNEEGVGKGIKASGVPRESIFLTTKLDNPDHRSVKDAFQAHLKRLDAGYIDLWLMHWPAPMKDGTADKEWDWLDTWRHMEEMYEANKDKVRAIGVSNFSVPYLERLLKTAKVVPAVNQVELHPALPQRELRKYCVDKGIVLTSYSPLGSDNSPLLKDKLILKIAEAHGCSAAQILISYQVHQPERIIANSKLVELNFEELELIDSIYPQTAFRACGPLWTGHGDLGMDHVEKK